MRWKKITIVGMGLLGGSLGLAIKRRKLAMQVCGLVRRKTSLEECKRRRVADVFTRKLRDAVSGADLIIICTPLSQMQSLVNRMLPALKSGAIVTDVGSVKGSVIKELESAVSESGAHFVGCHPMAGAEKSGVSAARASLFQNAMCVVTPTSRTDKNALRMVEDFWKAMGCRLMRLSPDTHDELVSRSSHLPHVVAATLAVGVLNPEHPPEQPKLCATGFRDTTRIASGSPEMWRDIALANRRHLGRALNAFTADLRKFQAALRRGDARALEKLFTTAKQRRDNWCACGASPSSE